MPRGGAAPLARAERRHVPRPDRAAALHAGRAPGRRAVLRPARRAHGGFGRPPRADDALVPGAYRARAARARPASAPRARDGAAADRLRRRRGARRPAPVPARAAPAAASTPPWRGDADRRAGPAHAAAAAPRPARARALRATGDGEAGRARARRRRRLRLRPASTPRPALLLRAVASPARSDRGPPAGLRGAARRRRPRPALRARRRRDRSSPSSRACSPTARRCASATAPPRPRRARGSVVADEVEALYARAGRPPPRRPRRTARCASACEGRPLIDVDLHMHTDHSRRLRHAGRGAAGRRPRPAGLGAIAVTDHNEISGALEARDEGRRASRSSSARRSRPPTRARSSGCSSRRRSRAACTLQETIAEIKRQGGLVYVPHPFDRMHAVPDYEHLLDVLDDVDAIEVFNPRVAIPSFNEEAVRFAGQVPDRRRRRLGLPCDAGARLGAHPHARLRRARGVPRVPARRRHHPQARPRSLYVQALKFLQTKATPGAARGARPASGASAAPSDAPRASPDAGAGDSRPHGSKPGAQCRPPTTRSARSTSSAPSASSTASPASCRTASTARAAT